MAHDQANTVGHKLYKFQAKPLCQELMSPSMDVWHEQGDNKGCSHLSWSVTKNSEWEHFGVSDLPLRVKDSESAVCLWRRTD
jgi:hypothetical protein